MPARFGKCTNFLECNNADSEAIIEVPEGAPFVCPNPDCQRDLVPFEKPAGRKWPMIVGTLLALAACVGLLFVLLGHRGSDTDGEEIVERNTETNAQPPVPPRAPQEDQTTRPLQNTERQSDVIFLVALSTSISTGFLPDTGGFLRDALKVLKEPSGLAFGLWGFRGPGEDNASTFEVKPILQQLSSFPALLAALGSLKPDESGAWKDDAVRALGHVLDRANWRPGAERNIVIITDSSSPSAQSDLQILRRKADDQKVRIAIVHVHNHKAAEDIPNGEQQYRSLSHNVNVGGKEGYYAVKGPKEGQQYQASYQAALQTIMRTMVAAQ